MRYGTIFPPTGDSALQLPLLLLLAAAVLAIVYMLFRRKDAKKDKDTNNPV